MTRPPTDFSRLLSGYFLRHLSHEKGLSPNTIDSRRTAFSLLIGYCRDELGVPASALDIGMLTPAAVTGFLDWLEDERGNSVATRNLRLDAIKSFFSYAGTVNPAYLFQSQQILSIPSKRTRSAQVRWLGIDEMQVLLGQIDSSTYHGLRDLALMALLYDSAARVSEIIGSLVSDLRLDRPSSIRLLGKGNKLRVVPLMGKTIDIARHYLEQRALLAAYSQSDPLFVNRSGNPLTRGGVSYILKKYAEKAALSLGQPMDKVSPHTLRHSKAVHMLQSGIPLIYIRDFLGHVEIATTEIYAKCEASAVRRALEESKNIEVEVEEPVWQREDEIMRWLASFAG